jgi:uncharacterized membrane protein YccF (DUF307 family)
VASLLCNIIWIIVAGIRLVIGHILTAIAQTVTIIGTPLAIANPKVIPVTPMPLGKESSPVPAVRDRVRPPLRQSPRPLARAICWQ